MTDRLIYFFLFILVYDTRNDKSIMKSGTFIFSIVPVASRCCAK